MRTPSTRSRRHSLRRLAVSAAATVALVASAVSLTRSAQPAEPPSRATADDPYPNFDIRDDTQAAAVDRTAYLSRVLSEPLSRRAVTGRERAAVARLTSAGAMVETHPALGLEVVSARPGGDFLTVPGADRVGGLKQFLDTHRSAYGLTGHQVQRLAVVADYLNPAGNMAWVEVEQSFQGIPVFQGLLRAGFTARGELVRTAGRLAADIDDAQLTSTPALSASSAVALAAERVGRPLAEHSLAAQPSADARRATFAADPVIGASSAWLVYFPLARGVARLAWATQMIGAGYGFLTVLDAETGTMLFRKNLAERQSQAATYYVYNDDSPAPSSPTPALPGAGYRAPSITRQAITRIGNEAPNAFNALGWMTDGANGTQGHTDGNNVEARAYGESDHPVAGTNRVFDFLSPDGNQYAGERSRAEATEVFYWANIYHDRLYRLGFTEAAGNFQQENFGRGGVAGDRISATNTGDRCVGPGPSCGGSFITPVDGGRGQLALTGARDSPTVILPGARNHRPSGFDHDILFHELSHGTSNRLHSNASGLSSTMSRGMGEGWSDFYARALLATADEDPNGVFAIGGWVTNILESYTDSYYYGLRRFPYAVRSNVGANGRPHNPLTFADIDPIQIDVSDGAYSLGPSGSSNAFAIHNIGEVWASALLEVRARFIGRLGFDVGNERFLQIVTDGMKLDPANPTMLQGRDAILAAALAGGGTDADLSDIWTGFAVRGMGYSARVVSADSGAVVEAFDLPGVNAGTTTLVSESIANGRLEPGETVSVSFCLTNVGPEASATMTASLQATGGVAQPSASQSYGVLARGAVACRTYTFLVSASARCGEDLTATLVAEDSSGATRTVTYTLPLGAFTPMLAESFDTTVAPAVPAGWSTTGDNYDGSSFSTRETRWSTVTDGAAADTGPTFAFMGTLFYGAMDTSLYSPVIVLPDAPTRLSFRHRITEGRALSEAAVLEIATQGSEFVDIVTAGGTFVSNGYDQFWRESGSGCSPIGRLYPCGHRLNNRHVWSRITDGWKSVAINLPPASQGKSVQLRWRLVTHAEFGWGNYPVVTGWSVDTIALSACAVEPASPTDLMVTGVSGNTVTLQWRAPAAGPSPTGYVVEGGARPQEVLASLDTRSQVPRFTFQAPTGSFFARVHALHGASRSTASNEVPLHVATPVAPSAPSQLLGLVTGNRVALSWRNTFSGGTPTSLWLDVRGPVTASIPLDVRESLDVPGVPAGTYAVSLRAANAGGTSASSTSVTLAVPSSCSGAPQAASGLLASSTGRTLQAHWDPPSAGAAPTSYVVEVTGDFNGSISTSARTLSGSVPPGTYVIRVFTVNPCGTGAPTSPQTVTVP